MAGGDADWTRRQCVDVDVGAVRICTMRGTCAEMEKEWEGGIAAHAGLKKRQTEDDADNSSGDDVREICVVMERTCRKMQEYCDAIARSRICSK